MVVKSPRLETSFFQMSVTYQNATASTKVDEEIINCILNFITRAIAQIDTGNYGTALYPITIDYSLLLKTELQDISFLAFLLARRTQAISSYTCCTLNGQRTRQQ